MPGCIQVGKLRDHRAVIRPRDGDQLGSGAVDQLRGSLDEAPDASGRHVPGLLRFCRLRQRSDVLVCENSIHLGTPVPFVVDETGAQPMQLSHLQARTPLNKASSKCVGLALIALTLALRIASR